MFGVIFDMDGTLLDTQKICIPAWDYAGENQGFHNVGKYVPDVCGMNKAGYLGYVKEKFPEIDIDRFYAEMRQYIVERLEVRLKDGAKELLCYLKSRGVKIALATGSSHATVEHHLGAVCITGYFDALVCGTEVKNCKPAPDIFFEAARRLGVAPADCFVFEDSENGIKAGCAAGMKCIGIEDIAPFKAEVKKRMFCQLDNMAQAIEIFEKM